MLKKLATFQKQPMRVLLTLLICSFLIHLNSMPGTFIYDDLPIIRDNPLMKDCRLDRLLSEPYWPIDQRGLFRPLTMATFCGNYALSGDAPLTYHLINIALHLANTALIFLIVTQLAPNISLLVAVLALAFSAHPIVTEAVNAVVGRAELLVTLFTLLGLWVTIKVKQRPLYKPWLWCLPLLTLMAALSKENGLLLPFIVAFYFLYDRPSRHLLKDPKMVRALALTIVVIVGVLLWRGAVLDSMGPTIGTIKFHHLGQRLLVPLQVIGMAMGKLLWPWNPQWEYDRFTTPASRSLFEWFPLLGLSLLVGVGIWGAKLRSRHPWYYLGLGLLAFATSLQIIPIGVIFSERSLYLPLAVLLSSSGTWLRQIKFRPARRPLIVVAGVGLLLAFAWRTIDLNRYWQSDWEFWSYVKSRAPHSQNATYNLAMLHKSRGNLPEAESLLRENLSRAPNSPYALNLLRELLLSRQDFSALLPIMERLVIVEPAVASHHNLLALSYVKNKDYAKAEIEFRQAIALAPERRPYQDNLAALYLEWRRR